MGTESVLCPVCQGVLPASGRESYTALRGRLIVTNGYCAGGCEERRAATEPIRRMPRQVPAVPGVAPVAGPVAAGGAGVTPLPQAQAVPGHGGPVRGAPYEQQYEQQPYEQPYEQVAEARLAPVVRISG
ncbi:hypothetical protein HTZ77_17555 [Nonomuraea sp. SMC257]|uniref:Uncharacterized protein n=1 Tax=Nonomuraea montanisoli TaxID=2741721 RepID=A0A7Y6I7L2_9ACTN|nr:hypothetical protein [Nonomuraea montanisoli]NUW33223.1 hypothetical protein [Nonomuraea montanisoli]